MIAVAVVVVSRGLRRLRPGREFGRRQQHHFGGTTKTGETRRKVSKGKTAFCILFGFLFW